MKNKPRTNRLCPYRELRSLLGQEFRKQRTWDRFGAFLDYKYNLHDHEIFWEEDTLKAWHLFSTRYLELGV